MAEVSFSIKSKGEGRGAGDLKDIEGFTKLKEAINGGLDNTNIKSGANIDGKKLAGSSVNRDRLANDAKPVTGRIGPSGFNEEGTGYLVKRTGIGVYEITLSTELSSNGICVVTSAELNCVGRWQAPKGGTRKVFSVAFVSMKEEAQDTAFSFVINPIL